MGYDIHMTRKEFWTPDDETPDIPLDEWKSFIETQDNLKLTNLAVAPLKDRTTLQFKNEGIAVWTGCSKGNKYGEVYLNYSNGSISVKNPDDEILKYMCDIAIKLKAIVRGDDGETYIDGEIEE